MKKTIIANSGREKQGKSETVKRIIKKIIEKYPDAKIDPSSIDFSAGDVNVIITIDKITIGIESQGDPNSRLPKSLNDFASKGCDLIICSTRTSGETVGAVHKLEKSHGYCTIWASNLRSIGYDQRQLNKLSANHLFELVEIILANNI